MPPRGTRGRGRGRAREASAEVIQNEAVLDPILSQLTNVSVQPTPAGEAGLASSSVGGIAGEPGASKPAASKFKPRMVKRVVKTEPDVDPNEGDKSSGAASARGGRGRGRGGADRGGRGRPEIVMTASGAFAMGPAEASVRRTAQGPSRSGMRRIDNSLAAGTDDRSKPERSGLSTPWDGGPSEMLELYSDIDEDGSDARDDNDAPDDDHRAKVADLNDITLEHSMAPLSLPWDPKRIAEREKLIHARNLKLAKLAQAKVKKEASAHLQDSKPPPRESTHHHSAAAACSSSSSSNPHSISSKVEHLDDKDENIKRDVKLKKDQLDELSNVGKQFTRGKKAVHRAANSGSEGTPSGRTEGGERGMYIFQFPRVFPQFREAGNGGSSSVAEAGGSGSVGEGKPGMARKIVKKKKPTLDDWLGWGKGGKRTECMGVPPGTPDDAPPVQGQIGELVIRRSGRVQMVIADVAYDVLPGAQPTFHQEIAVIDPSPLSHLRAMFVLGSTNHKFIVAPDVSSLLKREQSLKASSGIS